MYKISPTIGKKKHNIPRPALLASPFCAFSFSSRVDVPQYGQKFASSSNSLPHFLQYILFLLYCDICSNYILIFVICQIILCASKSVKPLCLAAVEKTSLLLLGRVVDPPARKIARGRRAYDKTRVFIAFLLAYKFSLFHVVRAYIRACVFSAFRANIFFPFVFTKKRPVLSGRFLLSCCLRHVLFVILCVFS